MPVILIVLIAIVSIAVIFAINSREREQADKQALEDKEEAKKDEEIPLSVVRDRPYTNIRIDFPDIEKLLNRWYVDVHYSSVSIDDVDKKKHVTVKKDKADKSSKTDAADKHKDHIDSEAPDYATFEKNRDRLSNVWIDTNGEILESTDLVKARADQILYDNDEE